MPDRPRRSAPRFSAAAMLTLALLAVVWGWWGWQDGGYFGVVWYPGAALLFVGLALLALRAPWPAGSNLLRPGIIAPAALAALGVWSVASALWSPAADTAIADGQRILMYACAFVLGMWLCALLAHRAHLAALPLVLGAAFAGGAAVVTMLSGDDPGAYLDRGGTLSLPLGYRNANAAFFLIAFWPAVALAQSRDLNWGARAFALATASISLDFALLSQSRASLIGVAAALLVWVIVVPGRARAFVWLALAVVPAALALPVLLDLYTAVNDANRAAALPELRAAGRAVVGTALIALGLGAAGALLERRFPLRERTERRADRVAAVVAATALLGGGIAGVVAVGDPFDWVGKRLDEFRSEGTPRLSDAPSRFTFNAGSNRADLWRVAIENGRDDPLRGEGGGGFQYSYLRVRESENQTVRDAHSIELEIFAELGLPGLALFAVAIGAAGWGAVRSRRLGRASATISATGLTAGAYWLAHSSLDWFWAYPALTASVLALLGAACAPALVRSAGEVDPPPVRPGPARWALAAAAAVLALSVIPPFLAERYTNEAYDLWRSDLTTAYESLDRAASLNPLSEEPLLAEGAIADASGDRRRALDAFERAVEKRPEEWAGHYLVGVVTPSEERAREALDAALELNPREVRTRAALARLRREGAPVD